MCVIGDIDDDVYYVRRNYVCVVVLKISIITTTPRTNEEEREEICCDDTLYVEWFHLKISKIAKSINLNLRRSEREREREREREIFVEFIQRDFLNRKKITKIHYFFCVCLRLTELQSNFFFVRRSRQNVKKERRSKDE